MRDENFATEQKQTIQGSIQQTIEWKSVSFSSCNIFSS